MRPFQVIGLLCLLVTGFPAKGVSADVPVPGYTIVADLNVGEGVMNATEKVHYVNSTGVMVNSVVFNVTPAFYNAFLLSSVKVGGKPVKTSLNGVVLEAFLSDPLANGAIADIEIEFTLKIPRQEGRLGMGEGIIALGNWYPVLAVYRNDWDRHQYKEIGDAFFTEVGNYDVTLKTNTPVTVAYTGRLISKDALEWKIEASMVRDFGLAISDRFLTKSLDVNGITVSAFYTKGHESSGELFLRAGAESLTWFSTKFGKYPYPSLHIAEIWSPGWLGTGQEYPSLILVGSGSVNLGGGMGDYLSYLLVHEVAHQWFYGIVGNDQVYAPWLDEAIATQTGLLFFKEKYPGRFAELWKSRVTDGYNQYRVQKGDRKVNSSIYDFDDELYYFAMVYRKGALFLEDLREMMGQDAYLNALRKYTAAYWHRIATPEGFIDYVQNETKLDIKGVGLKYFDYAFLSGPVMASPIPAPSQTPATASSSASATPTVVVASTAIPSPTVSTPAMPEVTPVVYVEPVSEETPIEVYSREEDSSQGQQEETGLSRTAILSLILFALAGVLSVRVLRRPQ